MLSALDRLNADWSSSPLFIPTTTTTTTIRGFGRKKNHAQTGWQSLASSYLASATANSGDGSGNLDVDGEKMVQIAVAGNGREDGFVFGEVQNAFMRSTNRMWDTCISYVVDHVNSL